MRAEARTAIVLTFGCLLAGCQQAPERVFVDVDRVSERPFLALEPMPLANLNPILAQSFELESLAPVEIQIESAEELARRGFAALEANQAQALQDTLERLRRAYRIEVRRIEAQRRDEILERQEILLNSAYEELYAKFLAMAQETGPRYWELSWLADFPDPDPESRRRPISARAFEIAYFERARELRAEIKALHLQHKEEIAGILDNLESNLAVELNELEREIGVIRQESEAQAIIDANEIARASLEDVQQTTIELRRVLPGIPAVTMQIRGGERSPHPPNMAGRAQYESHAEMVERQIAIFAKVQGYELVSTVSAGRDATEEFIEWRKQFQITR